MTKIAVALREVHDAETELASALRRCGERHRDEHDVFHLSRTLVSWCEDNLAQLAEHAARYDAELAGEPVEAAGGAADSQTDPGLLLLRDIRDLHLAAARASLAWTVLGQGAQALSDTAMAIATRMTARTCIAWSMGSTPSHCGRGPLRAGNGYG